MKQTATPTAATALQTQILCLNMANEAAKNIISYELGQLSRHIGKAIFKVDGSLKTKYEYSRLSLEKVKVNAFGFDFWVDTHYYHRIAYGKYEVKVITTVSGGGYDRNGVNKNHYQHSQSFEVFSLNDAGELSAPIAAPEWLNNQYNETEILQAAAKVEEAAKQYEAVLSKVPYLFRSTLYLQRLTNC